MCQRESLVIAHDETALHKTAKQRPGNPLQLEAVYVGNPGHIIELQPLLETVAAWLRRLRSDMVSPVPVALVLAWWEEMINQGLVVLAGADVVLPARLQLARNAGELQGSAFAEEVDSLFETFETGRDCLPGKLDGPEGPCSLIGRAGDCYEGDGDVGDARATRLAAWAFHVVDWWYV
jgi:hypothetical protein